MHLYKMTMVLLGMVLFALPASAVSNLSILSAGNGSYLVQGSGIEGAAAVECTIVYDAAVYGNPRVEAGALAAGAMMAVNPNTPGMVRIALIRTTPMSGSGPVLSIAFERTGEQAGRATLSNIRLLSIDGKALPHSVQMATAVEPAAAPSTASSGQETGGHAGTATSAGMVSQSQPQPAALLPIGGVVIAPKKDEERARTDDARLQREQGTAPARKQPADEQAIVAKRDDAALQSASRKIYSQKSVLDRFSEFRGKPTAAGYVGLFEQDGMIGFRQDPPVVLADGKSTVRVSFISSTPTRTTSDIALAGARLVSFKKDPDFTNMFILEVLPAKGELRASVSVPQDNVLMVFPLAVAPRVSLDARKKGGLDEAAFNAFLGERGTAEKPKFDLNNDGKRDYIDDYIFTANYIVRGLRSAASRTGR